MSPAIRIENISKQYRLGEIGTGSLAHDVNRWWHRLRGKEDPYLKIGEANDRSVRGSSDYVWALRDVSFDVVQGEVLGIIGRNGAGKSTLLKILSRVTSPTSGQVRARGRIASLLEVGTGFHPELTGRENIYLNGVILGMRKREITRQLDEIVDFSGCAKYLDTPVKRYSSGMTVRLGFAVAAHLRCEILIVDEVLAVGDAEFQRKAIGKMKDMTRGSERTVLFVSHNMVAVRSFCDRAILLRDGQLFAEAPTKDILHIYENQDVAETKCRAWTAPHSDDLLSKMGLYLKEAKIVLDDSPDGTIRVTSDFSLAFCVHADREALINLSPHYLGANSEVLFVTPSPQNQLTKGDNWFVCRIPRNLLNDGLYFIRLVIVENSSAIHAVDDALVFEVHDSVRDGAWHGKWPGFIRPVLEWNFQIAATQTTLASEDSSR